MADPLEETVGEAVGEPLQEKEVLPTSQNDVVKENGELPESLAEIGGKKKEDHTLNSTAPATGNGEPPVTSSEGANDTNRPSPPPQESSLNDGVEEGGQVQGVTPVPPTEKEHGSSTMHSIQEAFLSFVGLGSKPSGEKAHSPDVPRPKEDGSTNSEVAEKVPRVADGVPQSTETESTEIPEKGQTEEMAETGGHMQTKMQEGLEGIPKFAEETPNSVDGPMTEVERGTIEQVDTAKTDDALKTQGGEAEGLRKFAETNKPQAGAVSEAEIAKSEEKSDEAQGVEFAERNIPTGTPDMNEARELGGAEVAIFKADGTTERVGEGKSPKASKVVAPFYKAVATVAAVVEKAVSKESNSAAGAGQVTPAAEDSVEPRRIEEEINSQEVVAAPPPTPVEQEQPTVEADDTTQTKAFFGVVLKHVELNGKLSTESSSMGNRNSSNAEGLENIDKSPVEAHEKEYVAPLPAAITEEQIMSGDAVPSDVSQGKEAARTEADEAPHVEAKSDPTTSPGTPAVLEAVSTELSKNSATGTADLAEDGTVVNSIKETGISAPAVEEKEIPPTVVSGEAPGVASEEGKSPKASWVVAPFYKVVAKVADVVEKNSAPGTADSAEDVTVVDSTKETGVSAPAVEEKETSPTVLSREFPGGVSEEGKSAKASAVVAPFYKVVAKVADVVEKNSSPGTADSAEDDTVVDSTKETGVSAPAVEEKETSPTVLSREFPGGVSDEGKSPKASAVVAPFYKVVAKVADVVEKNSSPGTANSAEDDTVVDSIKETRVSAPAVEGKETPPAVVSREFPGGATEEGKSAKASAVVAPFYKVVAKVADVVEKNSSPGTADSAEDGTVVNSTKETGVSAPAGEEKETPRTVLSREFPGGVSEEGKSPKASGLVAPFYNVVAKVADVVEKNSSPGVADSAEDGTVVDSTKETGVSAPAVEKKETSPAVVSREFPGGVSEEGKSPKASAVVAPFYKVVAKVADVVENTVSPEGKPEEDGSALEKQPSLSVNIPKKGEAAAADAKTPEEETAEDLTTPRGTPLMQRVEHLELKLAQLESRQSPRSDFASRQSTPRSSVDRPFKFSTRYVLEETGSKGTLVDRVAALEQKLAHINLHPQSPSNGQSTPSISTVAENSSTEVDSKPAESQTPEWSPSAAEDDKAPEKVKSEEAAKATEDPLNPSVEENAPKDLPAQAQPVASQKTSRSNSLSEKKVKAKAAAGKIKGLFSGCFHPKKRRTSS